MCYVSNMLSDAFCYCSAECQCTLCYYAECLGAKLRTDHKIILRSLAYTHPGTLLGRFLSTHYGGLFGALACWFVLIGSLASILAVF
jgi:hypothetical protein